MAVELSKGPTPPKWYPMAEPQPEGPLTRGLQRREHRRQDAGARHAMLHRVIRSDRVHLRKGDRDWFNQLRDEGEIPPGHYGQLGYVEANKPYYDRVMLRLPQRVVGARGYRAADGCMYRG